LSIEERLAALAEHETRVRAFVCYDANAARKRAATAQGPLAGALIGVKDIVATADFPTRYGMDIGNAGPREDAWCVARIKQLGGAILGKTVCTAFAYPKPGATTNPHDASRTPGGSSSGSAAAVAAQFVDYAIGTQTAGSTIRPASYCGVVGFKPSYGLFPTDGVQAISTTLDHIGLFAQTPLDVWWLTSAMVMPRPERLEARRPRRLLMLRVPIANDYAKRLEDLRFDDVEVEALDLPFPLDDFRTLQQEICYWEASRIMLVPGRVQVVPELEALLAPYRGRNATGYTEACRRRMQYQKQFDALAAEYDAVLLPAATGAAPPWASTGDAVMNRFWTALHVPAITVPLWRDAHGMPLGLQMVGRLGGDRELVAVAQWITESAVAAIGR
jgi:Asp-tRNA(Asn)/Glu-tRNA(Gln) amidotransferase A subunit family amidase